MEKKALFTSKNDKVNNDNNASDTDEGASSDTSTASTKSNERDSVGVILDPRGVAGCDRRSPPAWWMRGFWCCTGICAVRNWEYCEKTHRHRWTLDSTVMSACVAVFWLPLVWESLVEKSLHY